jgi:hypothetical protein
MKEKRLAELLECWIDGSQPCLPDEELGRAAQRANIPLRVLPRIQAVSSCHIGNPRAIANPRGYPHETADGFNPRPIVKV